MDLQLVKTGLNFNEMFQSIKHDIVEAAVHEVLHRLSRGLTTLPSNTPNQSSAAPAKKTRSYRKKGEQETFECLVGCGKRFTSLQKHGFHLRGCNKKYHMDYHKQIKTFFGTQCSCGAPATHLCVRHGSWADQGISSSKRGHIKAILDIRDRGEAWAKAHYEMRCRPCSARRNGKERAKAA